MTTITATKARGMFYTLMNDIDEPVVITGKHGNKVLVSEDDWRAIEETNYLLSIPGLEESIKLADKDEDVVTGDEIKW
ncbi:type II toxin-antitoxin system Phd/YefM family antitoxin [Candidatus Saccharibacteria bacterium]|nr:type II toxin-antitoxin system Phd/YefM family antitoxin [Candidatus Saccharibacteria bacterium]